MKSKLQKGLLLLVVCVAINTLPGCQKEENCHKPPVKDPESGVCSQLGTIVQLPGSCAASPSGQLGILGENGKYYLVHEDLTGNFSNYSEGQSVHFGYKNLTGPCVAILSCHAPKVDHCITLTCIQPGRFCGTPVCNTEAEVVDQVNPAMNQPTGIKMLKINGKNYLVVKSSQPWVDTYPAGTKLLVDYSIVPECVITAVVTEPMTDGCISLKCATPR